MEMEEEKERERTLFQRGKLIKIFDKLNGYLNGFLAAMAGCSLFGMMLLVVGNSISRVFYVPFVGTAEVVGWLAALTAAFSLGFTQRHKGHVEVDLLVNNFPPKIRAVIESIITLFSTVFFIFIAYQLITFGLDLQQNGRVSETLVLVYYPFVLSIALGFLGLILALGVDFFSGLRKGNFR